MSSLTNPGRFKPRYVPFRHDRVLAQELPLMRLVAEEIVINSSTVPV